MKTDDVKDWVYEGWGYLWCLVFHRKHWKKLGAARLHEVTTSQDYLCHKCGMVQTTQRFRR